MKNKSIKSAVAFLIVVTALTSVSCAQHRPGGDRSERFRQQSSQPASVTPDILLLDLYLTEDQAAKITILRDNLMKEMKTLQTRMTIERERHKQFIEGQTMANSGAESEFMINLELLQGMAQRKREQYLQSVLQLLTPEQKVILMSYRRASGGSADRRGGADMEGDDRSPGGGRMGGAGRMGGRSEGGMGGRSGPGW